MNDSASKKSGWLRYGCFGCLGIAGFGLVAIVGLVGVAMMQVRAEQVEERVATPDLPVAAVLPDSAASAPVEMPSEPPPAPADAAAGVRAASGPGSGRVVLDLAQGAFEVLPGRPGERLTVEATYDKNSFRLEETLEKLENPAAGEPAWTYTVRFRRSGGSGFVAMIKELLGATQPRVRVTLPPDMPLVLDGRFAQGETRMDLGGLRVTDADVEFTQGGFELRVSEPLQSPMETLSLDGSMGGLMVSRLGNASPRTLQVDFSMGGLVLDLGGQWASDSDIDINASMGGSVVRLPRDVVIEGVPGKTGVEYSPTDELRPPILRFRTTSSMGEIEFQ